MSQPIIKTIDLVKTYQMGDIVVTALDQVSVEIKPGEFVAIMGPSGSGKSTLMNILGCLDRPNSGQYILAGDDVSTLNRTELAHIRNHRIGFIFQSYNLLSRASALQNVMLPLLYNQNGLKSIADSERQTIAMSALESVDLVERAHHLPKEMSGGQQQRVAIARALVNDPLIILADEPTGNLDSRSGIEIMEILCDLNQRGRTIVMVTHSAEIAEYAQRTIYFRDGRIEKDLSHKGKTKEKK
ncbi:MAG TPA: ABC transporter ATP-binding protein [Longilinea sp.]|nr:ABC transporter ATP-binding protein [Longilinea sp.]